MSVLDRRVFTDRTMRNELTVNTTLALRSFRTCNQEHGLKTPVECLEPLMEKCRQSNIVAAKVLSTNLKEAHSRARLGAGGTRPYKIQENIFLGNYHVQFGHFFGHISCKIRHFDIVRANIT